MQARTRHRQNKKRYEIGVSTQYKFYVIWERIIKFNTEKIK